MTNNTITPTTQYVPRPGASIPAATPTEYTISLIKCSAILWYEAHDDDSIDPVIKENVLQTCKTDLEIILKDMETDCYNCYSHGIGLSHHEWTEEEQTEKGKEKGPKFRKTGMTKTKPNPTHLRN